MSNLYTDQVLYINGTIIMYIIEYIMYDTMSNLYTNNASHNGNYECMQYIFGTQLFLISCIM